MNSTNNFPWLSNPAWRGNRLYSGHGWFLLIVWVIALVLLILAFTSSQQMQDFMHGFGLLEKPLKLLLQETAVIVALFALKQTWLAIRYGGAELVLDPFPGCLGGDVGGEVFVKIPYRRDITAEVSLELDQDEVRKEKNSHTSLWKVGGYARVVKHANGLKLQFRIPVPADLPASDISATQHEHPKYAYTWHLRVGVSVAGEFVGHGFTIPVFPTAQGVSAISINSLEYSPYGDDFIGLANLLSVEREADKLTVNVPMRGFSMWMLVKLIFGVQLLGLGWGVLLAQPTAVSFVSAAALVIPGLYLTGTTIYHHLGSLRVVFDGKVIQSERKILGIPVRSRYSGYYGVRAIEHRPSKHGHCVYATSEHGQIILAERLDSAWKAERVSEYFRELVTPTD